MQLSASFGRPLPVKQCLTAQDALDCAAKTRARIQAGYPKPINAFRSLTTEMLAMKAERDSIKDERDHYRAIAESLKESNEKLANEVGQLRAILRVAPPIQPDASRVNNGHPFAIERIQQVVCGFFQVSKIDLLGDRRGSDIVHPRHVAIYIAREYTGRSTIMLGRLFGGRDHATVINAHRKMKILRSKNIQVDNDIRRILARLSDTSQTVSPCVASLTSEPTPEHAAT